MPAKQPISEQLITYLDKCSEDDLIEEVLLPLFRQLGFHRITSAGHKDKALEYGKDIWMRYILPTQHVLYFGVQVKKGKLDAAGKNKGSNTNIAEIHNQLLMMLGHEILAQHRGGLSDGNHLWDHVPTIDGLGPSGGNAHCSERDEKRSKDQEYITVSSLVPKTLLNTLALLNLLDVHRD